MVIVYDLSTTFRQVYGMIRKLSITLSLALALSACASANKRLGQGKELEASGRYAEAAERYIQALKKDSRLDSARISLRAAGAAAIEQYMRTAVNPATQPDPAAEQFLAIDALTARALEVGVFLPPSNDYEALKRAAFDRAIADGINDAPLLANARQYANALSRLQRAGTMFQPNATQANALGTAGADVAIRWARSDTTEGLFRSAYMRVDPIGGLPGVTKAQVDDAAALQQAALFRGTKRIAVIPAWATVNARRTLPDDALPVLGDALLESPWNSPPRFVAMLPPDQVERDMRRMGLARRTISLLEAGRLARTTDVDFVVVTEIDSVRRDETGVRVTRRPVRTRSGVDTAYIVEEGNARLFAQATFMLVDRDGNRGSEYQSVNATASAPFTRIRYAGDYRTLDLRAAERDLFTRGADDRDLIRAFVPAMSTRLGEAVFAELVRRIP
jgi:tetratricopeptide (TPR) repeat protein